MNNVSDALTDTPKMSPLSSSSRPGDAASSLQEWLAQQVKALPPKASTWKEGMLVDVFDNRNLWCVAQIFRIEGKSAEIHYDGWSDKFNEVISPPP